MMAGLDSLDKKAKPAVAAALEPGEQVMLTVPGESGSALVATNRRVLVYKRGITAGSAFGKQLNSWEYSMVSGVEAKQAMTTQAIAALRRIIQEQRHASSPSQPISDPVEQLQRWASLRDQGILTEEEFQHQKRNLLGM